MVHYRLYQTWEGDQLAAQEGIQLVPGGGAALELQEIPKRTLKLAVNVNMN